MRCPSAADCKWATASADFRLLTIRSFSTLCSQPTDKSVALQIGITGNGRAPEEADLNLPLVLKPGPMLETGTGKMIVLGSDPIDMGTGDIGGWIRFAGWTLKVDLEAHLVWPIYPYNPYANARDKTLVRAVGRLSVPVHLQSEHGYICPHQREISLTLSAD